MAKKTRAQKKKSDERNLVTASPYVEMAPTHLPTSNIEISGLSLETSKTESNEKFLSHPFLRKDLVKVGALAAGAVVIEYVVSLAIDHGALSSWGIS